jgi:uncharacterized Zn-binding protein involved in type VI secretion
MATVGINPPKTPVTKGSTGIAKATLPNVCKMPGPPAPFVPSPLPNIAKSGDSPEGYSKKVKIEGNTVAIRGASFKSMGDIASKATGGGLVSANTHGPAKFIMPGSLTVKIEGKNVHLLGESMLNNCGPSGSPPNSATLMGLKQRDTDTGPAPESILCINCGKALSDPSHADAKLDTDNDSLMKQAANAPIGGHTKGGIQVGSSTPKLGGSSAGVVPINLASGRPLTIPKDYVDRWKATRPNKGFDPGNCVEQALLLRAFPGGEGYPPPGGPSSIKMGIAQVARGSRFDRKKKPDHKIKCATCDELLVAMLCTNPPKES